MMISIITVCYNAEKTISRCMESVYKLNTSDYEYIIIDGASTDKTIRIVNEWGKKFESLGISVTIISEKDGGIYNAMNKAINIAKGDWAIFINSDDRFADPEVVNKCFDNRGNDCDVLYGDVVVNTDGELKYQKARPLEQLKSGYEMPFCHQSTFTKTSCLKKYKFDENYRIIADIDLYLRLYEDGAIFEHIPCFVSVFSNDGISQTNRIRSIQEGKQLLRRHDILTLKQTVVLNCYLLWYNLKKVLPPFVIKLIFNIKQKARGN